jgi:multiple sugar transport system permease protein
MSSFWRRQRSWLTPVLFILPGIVLFGTVIVAASLQTVWVSFHEWDGVGPKLWVGLGNYVELLDDPSMYH